MDLTGWKFVLEFGNGLYIYAKGRDRVGVDKEGKRVVHYKMGPDDNPRCEECLATRVCNDST